MHFSKKSGCQSSPGPKILGYVNYCSAKFQPILDCFIPNSRLKYDESDNIKTDRVNTVVFNLHQIKHQAFFIGTPGSHKKLDGTMSLADGITKRRIHCNVYNRADD